MAWATTTDVLTFTGKAVADDELSRAQAVVELYASRTASVPATATTARDEHWLKLAVCYQAAWMQGQFDLYTRVEVGNLSQDGVSTTFTPDAMTLAPLARKALNRLAWRKTRSIHILSPFEDSPSTYPVGGLVKDYAFEEWTPL